MKDCCKHKNNKPDANHTRKRVISPKKFEENIYKRFVSFQQKTNEKIKVKQLEKLEEEKIVCKQLRFNSPNRKLNIGSFKERNQILLSKKDEYLAEKELQNEEKENLEMSECTFHPSINKTSINKKRTIQDLLDWAEKARVKQESIIADRTAASNLYSSRPKISKASLSILRERPPASSLEERLISRTQRRLLLFKSQNPKLASATKQLT